MTEVAGEVCDGFICHGFTTEKYLREVTLPRSSAAAPRPARRWTGSRSSGPSFVVTGNDARSGAGGPGREQQIAFYGSTPPTGGCSSCTAGAACRIASTRCRSRASGKEMGELIDDEILNAPAVVAEPEPVAPELRRRFGDVIERITFYAPY